MEDVRGRFVWHQLMTRDVPGAKKYYSKLIGWKTMPWPLDPAYTVCHADAGPVAGIMEIPSEAPDVPSHWLPYMGTRDVDAWVVLLRAGAIEERLWVSKSDRRVVRTEQRGASGVLVGEVL